MNRIDEIKKRLAAATPGPWRTNGGNVYVEWPDCDDDVVQIKGIGTDKDADMIANAPDDIAFLLVALAAERSATVAYLRAGGGKLLTEAADVVERGEHLPL